MQTIEEQDRKAFEAIGQNMFIEYNDDERAKLAQIADELRKIAKYGHSAQAHRQIRGREA